MGIRTSKEVTVTTVFPRSRGKDCAVGSDLSKIEASEWRTPADQEPDVQDMVESCRSID